MVACLAMFPGQGSQSVGMGKQLLQDFPEASLVFEEAEDASRIQLRKLCLEGPREQLELTAHQQPCILTLSVAMTRVLAANVDFARCKLFAGHSLGEYSALVASGKLTLDKAVVLVHKRGLAMQKAVPVGVGAMAAVLSYDETKLISLCETTAKSLKACVEVVNFNSPQQQIISGHKAAVEKVCALLKEEGAKTMPLPVSAPFHSSLMRAAREEMTPLLQGLNFSTGQGDIIANLTGNIEKKYHADLLIQQIDHPVLWTRGLRSASQAGVQIFLEIGPGKVLSGLAKRSLPGEPQIFASTDISEAISQFNKLFR